MAWTGHDVNLRTHPADVQVLKYLKNGVYPPSIAPDLDRAPGISPLTHATTSSLTTSLAASGLSGNSVTVEIPAVLGSLPHLKELYLDNNHIHGPIPSIFNNLTRFKRLEIQRNYIFDEFPDLGSLRKIYFLDASDNSVFGQVPSMFPVSLIDSQ
ncbi:receptor-like protein 19 [Hibiscus syriacus]|uniref:receptor-like protein 19 n=1 Tax=Hibiscus syriacus TaxID=106335 RepID=UPI0019239BC2|nr:receptor-like protein 19 [Hibiscus syriacus]